MGNGGDVRVQYVYNNGNNANNVNNMNQTQNSYMENVSKIFLYLY